MPSTYAHYLFGERAALAADEEVAKIIKENKRLFYIGLHGPDILFYYKPLFNNEVNAEGYAMHGRAASEFFKRARDMWQLSDNKPAAEAYLLGFACHFALDSACHGYIEKKILVSRLAHAEIENEFDRFLIYYDGKDIKSVDLTAHIQATESAAKIIAPFFKTPDEVQVYKALKSIKFYNNLLVGNRAYKRFIVNFCLRVSGKYKFMKGAMIAKKHIKDCADSNKRLFKLFNRAVEEGASLMSACHAFLNGGAELDERFNKTFGAGADWQNIPVFSAEEEDAYDI